MDLEHVFWFKPNLSFIIWKTLTSFFFKCFSVSTLLFIVLNTLGLLEDSLKFHSWQVNKCFPITSSGKHPKVSFSTWCLGPPNCPLGLCLTTFYNHLKKRLLDIKLLHNLFVLLNHPVQTKWKTKAETSRFKYGIIWTLNRWTRIGCAGDSHDSCSEAASPCSQEHKCVQRSSQWVGWRDTGSLCGPIGISMASNFSITIYRIY